MTSFQDLRQRRHAQWLTELKQQIYLFGSRARGDWDGLSDTDLLVVADSNGLLSVGPISRSMAESLRT